MKAIVMKNDGTEAKYFAAESISVCVDDDRGYMGISYDDATGAILAQGLVKLGEDEIANFRAGWAKADAASLRGERVRAGLEAIGFVVDTRPKLPTEPGSVILADTPRGPGLFLTLSTDGNWWDGGGFYDPSEVRRMSWELRR